MTEHNKLFYGDNLDIMRKYIKEESIDLCYIDPPFNSKRNYNQIYNNIGKEDIAQSQSFIDTWTWDNAAKTAFNEILLNTNQIHTKQTISLISSLGSVLGEGSLLSYIVSITSRVAEIHRLLKPTGSFYFHCDPTSSHYIKIVLDSIFCPNGGDYRNEISWKRNTSHNDAIGFSRVRDIIFFYTKSHKSTWNKIYQKYDKEYVKNYYKHKDADGRLWMSGDSSAASLSGGGYTYEWNGHIKLWRYPQQTMQKLHDEGKIFYTKNGIARVKRYLEEVKGMPVQEEIEDIEDLEKLISNPPDSLPALDVWNDIQALKSWHQEKLGYPTQKPEALLERIIRASSNEGDLVMDAYCGCGTTVAVAQRLKRKWIGIDITYQSISLILKRIEETFDKKITENIELNGVPRDRESAMALANKKDDRVRKEFEKWAILSYSNNYAVINEKKGSDKGIDGIIFILTIDKKNQSILFSVKSGKVGSRDIRDFRGTIEKENAAGGIFITLYPPTKDMAAEANSAGFMENIPLTRKIDKIKIITIDEIIAGSRFEIPIAFDVIKKAKFQKPANKNPLRFD
jgi:site-specific DNA-methyltransferase (adenine-specific)